VRPTNEKITAPLATRAFAQITAPTIEKKIRIPALPITPLRQEYRGATHP
jgi:hypothetical protein